MESDYIIEALVVYLPLAICGITGITNLFHIKRCIFLRLLTTVLCMFPVVAIASNVWNILPNNIELILFYIAPVPLLMILIIGLVFRKQSQSSILDSILLGLTILSSGWIATFAYFMSKIP